MSKNIVKHFLLKFGPKVSPKTHSIGNECPRDHLFHPETFLAQKLSYTQEVFQLSKQFIALHPPQVED